jgi:PAS domain S-box-containing protein
MAVGALLAGRFSTDLAVFLPGRHDRNDGPCMERTAQKPARGLSGPDSLRTTILHQVVPAALTIVLFIAAVFVIARPAFERHMRSTRQETARNLVETAVSLLGEYDRGVARGEYTLDEAQERAAERLRNLRYGPERKHYFYITDLEPVVVMHPYRREIEGTDILNMPDALGRPLIYAFLEIVDSPERGGFCYYKWQRQDVRGGSEDKVSYVQLFEPWGWIVGTGVYSDDVDARIASMTGTLTVASLAILAVILGLSIFTVVQSVRRERLRVAAEAALRERERTLAAILDNTTVFMGLLSPEGMVLSANRASLEFIGGTDDEVIGRPFWDTPWWSHSWDEQQNIRSALETCRTSARPVQRTASHIGADGRLIEVDFVVVPVLDAAGHVRQIAAEGRDVTAIRRASNAIRKNEMHLATILDSIQDGLIAVDAQGGITRLNPVARRLINAVVADGERRPIDEILAVTDLDGAPLEGLFQRLFGPDPARDPLPVNLTATDGETRTLEISATPIRAEDGVLEGGVVTLRDRTDEIQLRNQLFQAQKLEAIGQLAGGVAHDFNNLLTSILGNAELVQDELEPTGAARQSVAEILSASQRAAQLTSQLLAFSRKGKFQDAAVNMNEIADEVVRLLRRSIDKQIDVQTILAADPAVVEGDPSQLHNALLNLGLNARDAMPDGGLLRIGTRTITIDDHDHGQPGNRPQRRDFEPGKYLELTVADTGTGMSDEVKRHIFEPFFTTKPSGEGTGLGLAGVYGCVANHAGFIDVQTAPGEGTTFTITLPLSARIAPAGDERAAATVSGQGRILVVDDEEAVRQFAERALVRLGYEVVLCASGAEAVAHVREHGGEIDLVILDLIMPRMSGEQTFAALGDFARDLPIVIASGFSHDDTVQSLMQRGAAGFLAKPYQLAELSQVVNAHLRQRC